MNINKPISKKKEQFQPRIPTAMDSEPIQKGRVKYTASICGHYSLFNLNMSTA